MTFVLAYDLLCQLFLFLNSIACCIILENTGNNDAVLLTFKKPLLYAFYVMLLYGYNLFACMFNQFLKFQLLSKFTVSQFIPVALLLQSSAHSNHCKLKNIYICVNACKNYILALNLKTFKTPERVHHLTLPEKKGSSCSLTQHEQKYRAVCEQCEC